MVSLPGSLNMMYDLSISVLMRNYIVLAQLVHITINSCLRGPESHVFCVSSSPCSHDMKHTLQMMELQMMKLEMKK